MPDNDQSLNYPYGFQQAQAAQNQPNAQSCWSPITVRLDDATVRRIADAVVAKLRTASFIEPADA